MSDFSITYTLTRARFDDALKGLSAEQLNWRLCPNTLTIAESALHVAGVELNFASQLTGETLEGFALKVARSATEGVTNENPFPFERSEITSELVAEALSLGRSAVEPLLAEPDAYRSKEVKSALGPMIDGTGAFVRLIAHPFYHQGQAYLIRSAPGFPL